MKAEQKTPQQGTPHDLITDALELLEKAGSYCYWGVTYRALPGDNITSCIDNAIRMSAIARQPVYLSFNYVTIPVYADSDPETVYRDWHRELGRVD